MSQLIPPIAPTYQVEVSPRSLEGSGQGRPFPFPLEAEIPATVTRTETRTGLVIGKEFLELTLPSDLKNGDEVQVVFSQANNTEEITATIKKLAEPAPNPAVTLLKELGISETDINKLVTILEGAVGKPESHPFSTSNPLLNSESPEVIILREVLSGTSPEMIAKVLQGEELLPLLHQAEKVEGTLLNEVDIRRIQTVPTLRKALLHSLELLNDAEGLLKPVETNSTRGISPSELKTEIKKLIEAPIRSIPKDGFDFLRKLEMSSMSGPVMEVMRESLQRPLSELLSIIEIEDSAGSSEMKGSFEPLSKFLQRSLAISGENTLDEPLGALLTSFQKGSESNDAPLTMRDSLNRVFHSQSESVENLVQHYWEVRERSGHELLDHMLSRLFSSSEEASEFPRQFREMAAKVLHSKETPIPRHMLQELQESIQEGLKGISNRVDEELEAPSRRAQIFMKSIDFQVQLLLELPESKDTRWADLLVKEIVSYQRENAFKNAVMKLEGGDPTPLESYRFSGDITLDFVSSTIESLKAQRGLEESSVESAQPELDSESQNELEQLKILLLQLKDHLGGVEFDSEEVTLSKISKSLSQLREMYFEPTDNEGSLSELRASLPRDIARIVRVIDAELSTLISALAERLKSNREFQALSEDFVNQIKPLLQSQSLPPLDPALSDFIERFDPFWSSDTIRVGFTERNLSLLKHALDENTPLKELLAELQETLGEVTESRVFLHESRNSFRELLERGLQELMSLSSDNSSEVLQPIFDIMQGKSLPELLKLPLRERLEIFETVDEIITQLIRHDSKGSIVSLLSDLQRALAIGTAPEANSASLTELLLKSVSHSDAFWNQLINQQSIDVEGLPSELGRLMESLFPHTKVEVLSELQKFLMGFGEEEVRHLQTPSGRIQELLRFLNSRLSEPEFVGDNAPLDPLRTLKELEGLQSLLKGQELLSRMSPLFQAIGEPSFHLYPSVIHGFMQTLELTFYPPLPGETGEGDSSESSEKNATEHYHFRIKLPALGAVEVDLKRVGHSAYLSLICESLIARDVFEGALPELGPFLVPFGVTDCDFQVQQGTPAPVHPDWIESLRRERGIIA